MLKKTTSGVLASLRGSEVLECVFARCGLAAVGVHERTKEVLALADYSSTGLVGQPYRPHARVSRGTVYLHIILGEGVPLNPLLYYR